jgi:hypothetical protein
VAVAPVEEDHRVLGMDGWGGKGRKEEACEAKMVCVCEREKGRALS